MAMATCYLGTLPAELIDAIFDHVDSPRDLGCLVRAARFLHERFEDRKIRVIFRVLQNELGPALANAKFLYRLQYSVPKAKDQDREDRDRLHRVVAVYKDMLKPEEKSVPSMEELTHLCHMLYKIDAVASNYSDNYHKEIPGGSSHQCPPPHVEKLRIIGALYRRFVLCDVCLMVAFEKTRPGVPLFFDDWIDHNNHFRGRQCTKHNWDFPEKLTGGLPGHAAFQLQLIGDPDDLSDDGIEHLVPFQTFPENFFQPSEPGTQ